MIISSFTKRNERTQTDVTYVNTKTVSRGKSLVQGASGTVWTCMREIRASTWSKGYFEGRFDEWERRSDVNNTERD